MARILKDIKGNDVTWGNSDQKVYVSDNADAVIKAIDKASRQIIIIGSNEIRDRDGDIIEANGWDFDNYLKNPVVMWAHDYAGVPIAATNKVTRRKSDTMFQWQFAPEGIYPFADMIYSLYGLKQINACSVGFIPRSFEKITEPMLTAGMSDGMSMKSNRRYTKQELLEISGCAIPSNPQALQNAIKGFGVDDSKFIKYIMGNDFITIDPDKEGSYTEEIEKIGKKCEFVDETKSVQVQVPDDIVDNSDSLSCSIDDDFDVASKSEMKPYPNEHACRINNPDDYDRFARKNCKIKVDDKCVDVIYGINGDKVEIQAFRYPKGNWEAADAKEHCKGKGSFEPASDDKMMQKLFAGELSYDELRSKIELKLNDKRPDDLPSWQGTAAHPWWSVMELYSEFFIAAKYVQGIDAEYYKIGYSIADTEVTLSDERTLLERTWVEANKDKMAKIGMIRFMLDNEEDIEKIHSLIKEGRVLSGKNRTLITSCVTQMSEASVALNALLSATDPNAGKDISLNSSGTHKETKDDLFSVIINGDETSLQKVVGSGSGKIDLDQIRKLTEIARLLKTIRENLLK